MRYVVKEAYLALASNAKYLCGIAVMVCCVVTRVEKPGFCEDLRVDDFREHVLDV
jgi:hypothetical protein